MTKLLPPFSSVKYLQLNNRLEKNSVNTFSEIRKRIVRPSFNDDIFFIDSSKVKSDTLFLFQKNKVKDIVLSKDIKIKSGTRFFLLGTDEFGRDVLTRLIYGARVSLGIGILSSLISLLIGTLLGFWAGYFGGLVDKFLSRSTDMLLAFPLFFLIILMISLFGNSIVILIVILGAIGWMSLFKIVRGEIILLNQKEYFISAKFVGLTAKKLLLKEALPVLASPITTNIVFLTGNFIIAEAALSFLGFGAGINYPSWGSMVQSGHLYLSQAWWMIFFPSLMLIITLNTLNGIGANLKLNQIKNDK